MAYPEKTKRNKDIFRLRNKIDKETGKPTSFRKVADYFNIDVKTAYRAYKRQVMEMSQQVEA